MNTTSNEVVKLIEGSEIPEPAKNWLKTLTEAYGWEWWWQLSDSENPKGPGFSGLAFEILPTPERDEQTVSFGETEYFEEFIWNLESEFDSTEVDDEEFQDALRELVFLWCAERISYYRTVRDFKIGEARERTYSEINRFDFGGNKNRCRTCAEDFYDNLNQKKDEEEFYCSLACVAKAEFVCLNCGDKYSVGVNGNKAFRRTRLRSWCSTECEKPWTSIEADEQGWARNMIRRARSLGRSYDPEITRRQVFDRHGGECSYCGVATVFSASRAFDPRLGTVDHVIPWEKGGNHTWENVVLACWRCNCLKGTKLDF